MIVYFVFGKFDLCYKFSNIRKSISWVIIGMIRIFDMSFWLGILHDAGNKQELGQAHSPVRMYKRDGFVEIT